ncbi:MAG: ribonuclease H-like domain-containing protein [Eubacteriales bacterium]|nr:ribonuclease H-like domain-containing protein [Eubacteriales bacterium]
MINITKLLFNDTKQNKYTSLKGRLPADIYSILPDTLFFDIETTGLSARNSMCYLIGAAYLEDGLWHYTQWFADNPNDEGMLLTAFFKTISKFRYLIHFNGESFDIPFILQRSRLLGLPFSFYLSSKPDTGSASGSTPLPISIDLFKRTKKMKKALKLADTKQKTIENFLKTGRTDKYSGGELISVYRDYVIKKDDASKELLLLHNHDDIAGLIEILPVLCYEAVFSKKIEAIDDIEINTPTGFDGSTVKELLISASLPFDVPVRISLEKEYYYMVIYGSKLKIKIPFINQELKYFYPNYKDYYYLPDEDTAIYKSVASYVDKTHRQPARADNCYTRKAGEFLPQPEQIITPALKMNYKDICSYFEAGDNFIKRRDLQLQYTNTIIKHLITSK